MKNQRDFPWIPWVPRKAEDPLAGPGAPPRQRHGAAAPARGDAAAAAGRVAAAARAVRCDGGPFLVGKHGDVMGGSWGFQVFFAISW